MFGSREMSDSLDAESNRTQTRKDWVCEIVPASVVSWLSHERDRWELNRWDLAVTVEEVTSERSVNRACQCRPPGLPMTMRTAARPPDYLQRNPLHPSILKLQLVYAFSERPGLAFVTEET